MRIEPAIAASEEPQTYALDRAATGVGNYSLKRKLLWDMRSSDILRSAEWEFHTDVSVLPFGPIFNKQEFKKIFSWSYWPSLNFLILDDGIERLSRESVRNCHSYLLTPWSRVLLVKLTGSQLIKKFSAFNGIRKFITTFTSVCHLSLSEPARSSSYPHIPLPNDSS
jgi:hypothetical protein